MSLSWQGMDPRALSVTDVLWSGSVAGLAMIPVGMVFRSLDMRVNEYGRKTLELLVGPMEPPGSLVLMFLLHMVISWLAAVPLLVVLGPVAARRTRIQIGLVYGALFYLAINSLALPIAFGDPTPWRLGASFVLPSLVVHLVYGGVVAAFAGRSPGPVVDS